MKAVLFAALLISVLVVAPVQIGHVSTATLADQIQRSIDAVDWDSPMSWEVSHFGLMFTGRDTYGLWSGQSGAERIGTNSTYELVGAKLCAEIDGVGSSISIADVLARARYATQGHWWDTSRYLNDNSSGVSVDVPYLAYCYKYASEDGWDSAKWDLNSAYQEFLNCSQNSPNGFTWFYPVNGTSTSWMGVDRYYDENALPLAFFLNFYNQGITDALNYGAAVWSHLCADHWNSVGGFFPYKTGLFYENEVDCEVGPFWEIIGDLYAKSGETLPNFTSYLRQDLAYKLLNSIKWRNLPRNPSFFVKSILFACVAAEALKEERVTAT
jgi:hypothetical protein